MQEFDVDRFLARPLPARVATSGPTVRPVWFIWEDGAFWWLTTPSARLPALLSEDPKVALVVDSCELATLEFRQVIAHGRAELREFDAARAERKLSRYLGAKRERWPAEFRELWPGTRFVRLIPERLRTVDLSKQWSH